MHPIVRKRLNRQAVIYPILGTSDGVPVYGDSFEEPCYLAYKLFYVRSPSGEEYESRMQVYLNGNSKISKRCEILVKEKDDILVEKTRIKEVRKYASLNNRTELVEVLL